MAVEKERVYASVMSNNKNMSYVNTVPNNGTSTHPEPDLQLVQVRIVQLKSTHHFHSWQK